MTLLPIVPDPLASEEQFRRYVHADLPDLDAVQLWQEAQRVAWHAAWADPVSVAGKWLFARLAAVRAEQQRRRRHVRAG